MRHLPQRAPEGSDYSTIGSAITPHIMDGNGAGMAYCSGQPTCNNVSPSQAASQFIFSPSETCLQQLQGKGALFSVGLLVRQCDGCSLVPQCEGCS